MADALEARRLIAQMQSDAVLLDHDTPSATDERLRALLCGGLDRGPIPLAQLCADPRVVVASLCPSSSPANPRPGRSRS